jgi:hypothetical protein
VEGVVDFGRLQSRRRGIGARTCAPPASASAPIRSSVAMRRFFERGNAQTMQTLAARFDRTAKK